MSEQEKVKSKKQPINKNNEKKPILGHPDFTVDNNTLILARQRCIEEINGKQVRAMYARLAALGATIVANEADTPLGKYPTAKMQRSGPAVMSETKKMIQIIQNNVPNPQEVIYVPTHGNPSQLINTAKAIKSEGANLYFGNNLDVLSMQKGKTQKAGELSNDFWIGVCEESDNTNGTRTYTYSLIDENFIVHQELQSIEKKVYPRYHNSKYKQATTSKNHGR